MDKKTIGALFKSSLLLVMLSLFVCGCSESSARNDKLEITHHYNGEKARTHANTTAGRVNYISAENTEDASKALARKATRVHNDCDICESAQHVDSSTFENIANR